MNKTAKTYARPKPVKKSAKTAAAVKTRSKSAAVSLKPLKKTVKKSVKKTAKTVNDSSEPKRTIVPLAEVEVLAAKAVKMIKAKRSASPEKKAIKLANVAETLEQARRMKGLSKCGAWGLKHPFGLDVIYIDWEAVLR